MAQQKDILNIHEFMSGARVESAANCDTLLFNAWTASAAMLSSVALVPLLSILHLSILCKKGMRDSSS